MQKVATETNGPGKGTGIPTNEQICQRNVLDCYGHHNGFSPSLTLTAHLGNEGSSSLVSTN